MFQILQFIISFFIIMDKNGLNSHFFFVNGFFNAVFRAKKNSNIFFG